MITKEKNFKQTFFIKIWKKIHLFRLKNNLKADMITTDLYVSMVRHSTPHATSSLCLIRFYVFVFKDKNQISLTFEFAKNKIQLESH